MTPEPPEHPSPDRSPVPITSDLVRRLIAAQFPAWAGLPVRPVAAGGWDNRTFHLGDALSVRLPSAAGYVAAVEKEQRWLARLAPHLPVPIPAPVARGVPGEGYPWPWSVNRWLAGETAAIAPIPDPVAFARDLATFLLALRAVDATGGPLGGEHSFHRGASPAPYDAATRQAIWRLRDRLGPAATATATAVWDAALASTWEHPPVWFHGDVAEGNLLVRDGRLAAMIDFGTCGVGDPACDLVIAWTFLSGAGRSAFRAAMPDDDATWARARGWALWKALITYDSPDPARAAVTHRIVDDVLADHVGSVAGS